MGREISVLAHKAQEGFYIQSPSVGFVSQLPLSGQIIRPESPIGYLHILSNKYVLKTPPNVYGQVVLHTTDLKVYSVEYAQTLFSLIPCKSGDTIENSTLQSTINHDENTVKGQWKVLAISDGIFYRKPSPEALPYVDVGQEIHKGQVLGLVEVMKCFNKLIFDGPNFPEKATLIEIHSKDAQEVKYGQTLFVFA